MPRDRNKRDSPLLILTRRLAQGGIGEAILDEPDHELRGHSRPFVSWIELRTRCSSASLFPSCQLRERPRQA